MNSIKTLFHLFIVHFLGQSPVWYKITITSFLILNPILYYIDPFIAGWAVLVEFIFTLACALKCYPLQPGGLLAIQAILIGLTSPKTVYQEILVNIPTLLLLIFLVAAVYFIKDVLFIAMTKLCLTVRRKYFLSLIFCMICAFLAAFVEPFPLVAIAVAVCFNFYAIYHRVEGHDNVEELEEFRGFLRNLIIHGTAGAIMGGAMTKVGEPQNYMIGDKMGWEFVEFIQHCAVVSIPAAITGFIVCFSLEYFRCPGFRYQLPERARELILKDYKKKIREMTPHNFYVYGIQIMAFILLVLALAFHVAEVGLIGVTLIVVVTAFTGQTKEHDLGVAFTNAMPFAVLILVFFAILGVVHEQHLIAPLAEWVFTFSGKSQLIALYFTNGSLSFVSDNVFIATVFINEVEKTYVSGIISQMLLNIDIHAACADGTISQTITQYIGSLPDTSIAPDNELITRFIRDVEYASNNGTLETLTAKYADKIVVSREEYEKLAVVVNMGTNIPAMATPNGHAALLFLLTSALAPLLNLSYFRMFKLTLPYTIGMTITGAVAIYFFL